MAGTSAFACSSHLPGTVLPPVTVAADENVSWAWPGATRPQDQREFLPTVRAARCPAPMWRTAHRVVRRRSEL